MSDTTFADNTTPVVPAAWLNDVNDHVYSNTFSFAAGVGGTVTQANSKSTLVALNKTCGEIVLNSASLAAGATVGFWCSNSTVLAGDVVVVSIASVGSADSYNVSVDYVADEVFHVVLTNVSGGALSQAAKLNFSVVKGAVVDAAPSPLPDAPTIGTATKNAEETEVSVTFTPPAYTGGSAISLYTISSVPAGYTATGAASPIVITPAIGTTYTYTVRATNATGDGPESEESNAVKLRTKSYAAFDGSAKNADVVLNGNSATCSLDNFHQVNTDKFTPQTILYAEFTLGLGATGFNTVVGINTAAANFDNGSYPGYDNGGAPNGPGYGISGDGRLWHVGTVTANSPLQGPPSFDTPEVISMLFNSSTGTIRIWEDGVERRGQGDLDPITGVAAGSYCLSLAVRKNGATSSQVTFNAGASAWAYPAIPAAAGALGWFSWVE